MQNISGGNRYIYRSMTICLEPEDLTGQDHPLLTWANRTQPLQVGPWHFDPQWRSLSVHHDNFAYMYFVLPAKADQELKCLLETGPPFKAIALQIRELLSEYLTELRDRD